MRVLAPGLLLKLAKGLVFSAGWFGLAYLGYWLALAVDRVLVPAAIYPFTAAPAIDWVVTAFRASVQAPGLLLIVKPFSLYGLLLALPLALQVALLIFLARRYSHARAAANEDKQARSGAALLRIWLHFAGLWTVLLLALQAAFLAIAGFGQLAELLRLFTGANVSSVVPRIVVTVLIGAALLAAGGTYARRLMVEVAAATQGWRPGWMRYLAAVLLLALPVQWIVWGLVGFRFHSMGIKFTLTLLVPGAFCLLLALVSFRRRSASLATGAFRWSNALEAAGLAAMLYAGLANAQVVRSWASERHLARYSSSHYEILYDASRFDGASIRALADERERVLAAQAKRLGIGTDALKTRVVLYPDFESYRRATSSERTFIVEGTIIRAVLHGFVRRLDPTADAAALLHAAWSPGSRNSAPPLLQAWVAAWLAGEWRGRSPAEWAARIANEEGPLTLAELMEPAADHELSPLVRNPVGAAWVGLVYDRFGLEGVRRIYRANLTQRNPAAVAKVLNTSAERLEQDWKQRTAELQARFPQADPPTRPVDGAAFLRGVSFSHEGWSSGRGGYDSPAALEELRLLHAMGVNAVAAVPYGFVADTSDLTIHYTGTDESDEELTQLLYIARGLGMKVMLKPQLWVAWSEFTGKIRFDDPARRSQWMRSYRRFILHYARLAELEGFDLLCIGNEFEGLTAHEEDWRRLTADVRRVYHGPITYAANWGSEFESVRFWDALDYIGLNNYYPLQTSKGAEPGAGSAARVEDLVRGAQALAKRIEAVSQKWHRPVLFTEVGYPSVRGGTAEPWVQQRTRGISLEEQAAGYEAVFRAFSDQVWFRGMFWWKWPSNGRGGGAEDASFTPRGKPAAEVLRAWFTRLAGTPDSSPAQTP